MSNDKGASMKSDTNPRYKDGDPVLKIGRYKISKYTETSLWIEDTIDGDAGEFRESVIEELLGEFYNKNL